MLDPDRIRKHVPDVDDFVLPELDSIDEVWLRTERGKRILVVGGKMAKDALSRQGIIDRGLTECPGCELNGRHPHYHYSPLDNSPLDNDG
jgi:hypothetical protein